LEIEQIHNASLQLPVAKSLALDHYRSTYSFIRRLIDGVIIRKINFFIYNPVDDYNYFLIRWRCKNIVTVYLINNFSNCKFLCQR
ncbi:hypothetical protein, partial [Salmonella enterica]